MKNLSERELKIQAVGFFQGKIAGITDYAVWLNGEQFVGVMRRPLKEVVEPIKRTIELLERQIDETPD